jgi:hypothetical protein
MILRAAGAGKGHAVPVSQRQVYRVGEFADLGDQRHFVIVQGDGRGRDAATAR